MTSDDIKNFKKLMLRMRKEDPEFRFSNSRLHQYRMGPTLSENELQAFEQKHQVTLPADYRFFLKEAWNGGGDHSIPHLAQGSGAGPGCGLLPLDRAIIGCDLSKPFLLTESTEAKPFPGMEQWGDEESYPGVLEICYYGGALFHILVVKGPAYGTVWDLHEDFTPVNFFPTGLTFEEWYLRWIDQVIHKAIPVLANERIAASVEAGMTKAQVIAICGGNWKTTEYAGKPHFTRFLQFERLKTEFELDANDVVIRIVRHSIYETGKYKT